MWARRAGPVAASVSLVGGAVSSAGVSSSACASVRAEASTLSGAAACVGLFGRDELERLLQRGIRGIRVMQLELDLAEAQPELRLLRSQLQGQAQLLGRIGQALLGDEHAGEGLAHERLGVGLREVGADDDSGLRERVGGRGGILGGGQRARTRATRRSPTGRRGGRARARCRRRCS